MPIPRPRDVVHARTHPAFAPLYEKIKQTYPERDLSSLDSVMEALRWMLQTNNIKLRPPENVFLDDRTANLIVRSSMTNMEAIELFIQKVNTGL